MATCSDRLDGSWTAEAFHIGAGAVVLFSHVLFQSALSATLGVKAPVSLKSPDIYKPLFWGGLWGILFGLFIKTAWNRLYLAGFLYVLAPLLALFLFFLPMSGAGYFGLHRGPTFTVYLLLVNLPFGIVTALAARAIIGRQDRKSTRLNSSHMSISYAVFCLKKKNQTHRSFKCYPGLIETL